MPCQFLGFFDNLFEVCLGREGFVGVPMVVTDLLQDGTEQGMFGHPWRHLQTRTAVVLSLPKSNADCHMISWYGPFTQIVGYVEVAVAVTCLRHGHVDERSVDPG